MYAIALTCSLPILFLFTAIVIDELLALINPNPSYLEHDDTTISVEVKS
jgi:hypothetical protein